MSGNTTLFEPIVRHITTRIWAATTWLIVMLVGLLLRQELSVFLLIGLVAVYIFLRPTWRTVREMQSQDGAHAASLLRIRQVGTHAAVVVCLVTTVFLPAMAINQALAVRLAITVLGCAGSLVVFSKQCHIMLDAERSFGWQKRVYFHLFLGKTMGDAVSALEVTVPSYSPTSSVD